MLLMLMLRNVLTTVWSRFWIWGLVEILNLNSIYWIWSFVNIWSIFLFKTLRLRFGQDFEAKDWSMIKSWILVKILRLKLDRNFEAEVQSSLQSWSLVEILKLNLDQVVVFNQLVVWPKSCFFGESTGWVGQIQFWFKAHVTLVVRSLWGVGGNYN